MTGRQKRNMYKYLAIVAFIATVALGVVYLTFARNENNIKVLGGYVTSYEKVSDNEYKAQYVFYRNGEVFEEKTYTQETEPKIGDSKNLYYVGSNKAKLVEEKPNLYLSYIWIAVAAGVMFVLCIVFVVLRKNQINYTKAVVKNIKVDENAMYKPKK